MEEYKADCLHGAGHFSASW